MQARAVGRDEGSAQSKPFSDLLEENASPDTYREAPDGEP
jgi:hypothetical protein